MYAHLRVLPLTCKPCLCWARGGCGVAYCGLWALRSGNLGSGDLGAGYACSIYAFCRSAQTDFECSRMGRPSHVPRQRDLPIARFRTDGVPGLWQARVLPRPAGRGQTSEMSVMVRRPGRSGLRLLEQWLFVCNQLYLACCMRPDGPHWPFTAAGIREFTQPHDDQLGCSHRIWTNRLLSLLSCGPAPAILVWRLSLANLPSPAARIRGPASGTCAPDIS